MMPIGDITYIGSIMEPIVCSTSKVTISLPSRDCLPGERTSRRREVVPTVETIVSRRREFSILDDVRSSKHVAGDML